MHRTATARRPRRIFLRASGENGFTVPELLIAMAILAVVITALTSVLVTASENELDANKRFRVQGQARAGLEQLRRELHCASAVTQADSSRTALNPGTAYNAITATLSSACATTGGQNLYVTWCTAPSTLNTSDYALYRVTSTTLPPPTCTSTGKVKWADYLTTPSGNVFCLPSSTAAVPQAPCAGSVLRPPNSLPMLHVTMPVNVNGPSSTIDGYNLVDDIALRNGTFS